jgi:hypothetical protein
MKTPSRPSPSRSFRRLFGRFHTTLFTVLVLAGLVYAALLLSSLLTDATIGGTYQSPITAGSIDQTTLDRINALHTSDGELPPAPPSDGRTNPFVE